MYNERQRDQDDKQEHRSSFTSKSLGTKWHVKRWMATDTKKQVTTIWGCKWNM